MDEAACAITRPSFKTSRTARGSPRHRLLREIAPDGEMVQAAVKTVNPLLFASYSQGASLKRSENTSIHKLGRFTIKRQSVLPLHQGRFSIAGAFAPDRVALSFRGGSR